MKKAVILSVFLCLAMGISIADDGQFKPVKLEVGGLDYDLKKQEEYKINNDVFEFRKWYVEPIETNQKFEKSETIKETAE